MADLSLTKTVVPTPPARTHASGGGPITFTVTLHNGGPATATGVEVTDALNSSLFVYDSHTASPGTYNQTTGLWSVGMLASGSDGTLTIMAHENGCQPFFSTGDNTATVTAEDQTDSNPANDQALAQVLFGCN